MIALEVQQLTKRFGGVHAVDGVSFTIPQGSLTALIGPNGAGKSTLFNLLTNLYLPDGGTTLFYGVDLRGKSPEAIAALGLVRTFQTSRCFPDMTLFENVLVGGHLVRARLGERGLQQRAGDLLRLVGLSASAKEAAANLTLGSQKLLEIARALMAAPKMLLLDEPAAGLNDAETDDLAMLLCAVRASGVSVVVVEHNMSLVMGIADEVIVLDAGRLIARGTPREIQSNVQVVEAYVGRDVSVAFGPGQ